MRKLIIVAIVAMLIYVGVTMVFDGLEKFRIPSYEGLEQEQKVLEANVGKLNNTNGVLFETEKANLATSIKNYKDKKAEYEAMEASQKELALQSTDLYDLDFLWTIIGNYASDQNVILQLDVTKSPNIEAQSDEYVMCDITFTGMGDYADLVGFIYDVEDDDRMKFEFSDFNMINVSKEEIEKIYPDDIPTEEAKKKVKACFKATELPVSASTFQETNSTAQATNEIINAVDSNS
ncbi:MAG: hypothetical protein IKN74_02825 [Clostridia bacterium]|nr:hypothetical protein [Clostridia bacterium]